MKGADSGAVLHDCDSPNVEGYVIHRTEGRNLCVWCGKYRSHRGFTGYGRSDVKACAACFKLIEAVKRIQRRAERITGRGLESVLRQITMANRTDEGAFQ